MIRKTGLLLTVGSLAVLVAAAPAVAHEMFLKPTDYRPAPDSRTVVALFNGTYDKSENPITRDRMQTVAVASDGQLTNPPPSQWRDDAATSYLDLAVGGAGTYVVAVSTAPRIIELSADNFEEYLRHDGIEDTLKAREAEKGPRTPVKERYSKHVTTILQVGEARTDDHARPLGLPAEILLATNPASLKAGDTLDFRALLKGQPMAGQLVYAGVDGGPPKAVKLRTDSNGQASFRVDRAGRWYVTLINMQKVTDEAAYESNWSTVTFEVR